MKKNIVASLCLIFLCCFLSSCGKKAETEHVEPLASNFPVEVAGVLIPEKPTSVVSLSPALTEDVILLSETAKLVGVSSHCNVPEPLRDTLDMGTALYPNIPKIVASGAEYVLSQAPLPQWVMEALRAEEISVLVISRPEGLEGIGASLSDLTLLFLGAEDGKNPVATSLYYDAIDKIAEHVPIVVKENEQTSQGTASLEETILEVEESVDEATETTQIGEGTVPNYNYTVLYLIADGTVAVTDAFETDLFRLLSLENIAKSEEGERFASGEDALALDPDIILVSGDTDIQALLLKANFKKLNAVKEGRVFPIYSEVVDARSVRIVHELFLLAKMIYGEEFTLSETEIEFLSVKLSASAEEFSVDPMNTGKERQESVKEDSFLLTDTSEESETSL